MDRVPNEILQGPYKNLQGMKLEFVSGVLEERPEKKEIGYTVTFKLSLDFDLFEEAANIHIPGYFNRYFNAIRPELRGLAYHYSQSFFGDSAGKILKNEDLFGRFTHQSFYYDDWMDGNLLRRYGKPNFEIVDGQLQVTAMQDFRLENDEIQISDLPIIQFDWALNLMMDHWLWGSNIFEAPRSPVSIVIFGCTQEELMTIEGEEMRLDTRYMVGKDLKFGDIQKEMILTARKP
ncbi:hypothetical protein ACYZT7_09310 [Pseudomonas sp. RT4P38]